MCRVCGKPCWFERWRKLPKGRHQSDLPCNQSRATWVGNVSTLPGRTFSLILNESYILYITIHLFIFIWHHKWLNHTQMMEKKPSAVVSIHRGFNEPVNSHFHVVFHLNTTYISITYRFSPFFEYIDALQTKYSYQFAFFNIPPLLKYCIYFLLYKYFRAYSWKIAIFHMFETLTYLADVFW